MKYQVFALTLLGSVTAAQGQSTIPDLKGVWSGKGKALVYGHNAYHPGSESATSPPRVREIEATHVVDGQDGRLVWGRSSSSAAKTDEPFAWTIGSDNKTIIGADMDGYFQINLLSDDRMDKCYVHNGTSPSASIVATCYVMERTKR